jgi:Flp pilus assembly protein TadG
MRSGNPVANTNATIVQRRAFSGQGLVELALIMPILVLFLLIAADFGRAYTAHIAISSAAREGASFGSRSLENAENAAAVRAAALAQNETIWGDAPTVTSNVGEDEFGYDYIEVEVDYTFDVLFPFPPIPDSLDMSRTVRMRVIGN